MVIVISPAKRIKFDIHNTKNEYTIPENLEKSQTLINILKKKSKKDLEKLMDINPKLAEENIERFALWNKDFNLDNARQAILSFSGDVFLGINAKDFNESELKFAQKHLRILSGLHGILRPLDLIMPYRLEMGLKLNIGKYKNLYEFWGDIITNLITGSFDPTNEKVLINLASAEYFKSINYNLLTKTRIVTPDFREYKDGKYKFVHVNGKKARGLMCRFIIKNKITVVEQLKLFDLEGYNYNDPLSENDKWVFTRG